MSVVVIVVIVRSVIVVVIVRSVALGPDDVELLIEPDSLYLQSW